MKATAKQVNYLAYKLQDYGMVQTDFHLYEEKNKPEAVKICSDKWEEVFGKRIEDLEFEEMQRILDIFQPNTLGNKEARQRLHKKLNKFSKD
jgi:hypothetical protein